MTSHSDVWEERVVPEYYRVGLLAKVLFEGDSALLEEERAAVQSKNCLYDRIREAEEGRRQALSVLAWMRTESQRTSALSKI